MAKIKFKFNPHTGDVEMRAINSPDDREVVHEAFRNALKRSHFKSSSIEDIGEDKNERPIREEKEQLITSEKDTLFE